jgi:hypothetical protein
MISAPVVLALIGALAFILIFSPKKDLHVNTGRDTGGFSKRLFLKKKAACRGIDAAVLRVH